jgi:PAS domain S-box-containing protein
MWITSLPLEVEKAREALQKAVPNLDEYFKKGQIEIISSSNCYLLDGKFDSNRVLQGWVEKEKAALKRGFEGMRLTGNTLWIERELWKSFVDYEEAINSVIGEHKMLALCTYGLKKCSGTDVLDVVRSHIGTLVKQDKKWYLIEDAAMRKAVNGALKLSERKYSALFENMQDSFAYHKALFDEEGRSVDYVFLEVNNAFERLTGLKRPSVLGEKATRVLPRIENDPAYWVSVYGKVALTGTPLRFESFSDTLQRWYLVSAFSPEKGYFAITFEDITERKKAEDTIRKSEERYRSYIEVTGELGWTTNADGEAVEDIPSFRSYTGQSFEEVKGWGWSKAIHPNDIENTTKAWKKALAAKRKYEVEYRLRRSDGVYRHFLSRGVPVFKEDGSVREWVGTCIDITDRKEMEKELLDNLKASQRRQSEISALLEASKAVLQYQDFKRVARVIFDSCKDLLGATAGYVALLNQDGTENEVLFLDSGGLSCKVDPSLPMPIRGLRAEVYRTGKVAYSNNFTKTAWVNLMPHGHVALQNVMFAPLTIGKNTVGLIGLANKSDDFVDRDAQMAKAFGEIASVALINSRVLEKLEKNEKLLKAHSERLEDMVEEKTKQLRDKERLAAIGATAGMVGHDIRNPLQAIIGDLYLAKTDLATCPDSECKTSVQECLTEIEKNVEYINKIVADLQDFARPLNPITSETDLKLIIDELVSYIPENIQVSSQVEKSTERIVADSDYVKRILTNLVNNAIQAMPSGGKLTIQAYIERNDIAITVADTGVGIPEEAKIKIFTPLFTTKSKGQGFGLPVVKRMTEALGGKVTFESKAGEGTKFIVKLPKITARSM